MFIFVVSITIKTNKMSNLKPLVKTNELSTPNLNNFDLDIKILKYRSEFGLQRNNKEFLKAVGITSGKYGGRIVSLINRGHLERTTSITSIKDFKNGTANRNATTRITSENKLEIVKAIKGGMKNNEVVKTFKISLASVSRLKKQLAESVVVKNTYTNSNGLNKEIARNKMTKYIVDSDVLGLIPTLPHIECTIEKKILIEQPTQKFLGVEYDKDTYNQLNKTVRTEKLPINTYYGKLADKIYGQVENTYAHIIADYCGMLPTFSKEIEYAVQNKVVKVGGIIAMTFGKPIRGKDAQSEFIKALGCTITNNPNDQRCMSDKATEAYFNRIIGDNFEFVEIFNYSDDKVDADGSGYPMTLVILRRKS